jgi:hypothetical protein
MPARETVTDTLSLACTANAYWLTVILQVQMLSHVYLARQEYSPPLQVFIDCICNVLENSVSIMH